MKSEENQPLLVELFTEELPPKALKKLGDAFAEGLVTRLEENDFLEGPKCFHAFATPRRLAVLVEHVREISQPRARPPTTLMPVSVGLDAAGNPTPALVKRLHRMYHDQVDLSWLMSERIFRETEGGKDVLKHREDLASGSRLSVALEGIITDAIEKLPIPKVMSYQLTDGLTSVQFIRPAHGLVAMHGSQVIENIRVLGLQSSNNTSGHRFQGKKSITISHASDYEAALDKQGGVIASFEKRRDEIERLLNLHADQCGDVLGNREDYAPLLDEVTALVEMPTVYVGQFEEEFLEVPPECLILTMKLNQKYFPLFHSSDKTSLRLSSRFLIVSNMRLDDPRNVIEGNQRVIRPRLSDARFFFQTDKKTKLADRLPKLKSVVYHNKLGSQGERVERVRAIAQEICRNTNKDAAFQASVDQAAVLAKADLVTDMVGEFPELQGTMGKYYALHEGIHRDVAEAIEDHYKPRFAGDALPRSDVGVIVALADKLETLAGLFSIGQEPSGDKDPFALRRHALGAIRMLIERALPLSVHELIAAAMRNFPSASADASERLATYIFDRLVGYLREQGYSTLEVDAVVSARPPWAELTSRLAAVRAFASLSEAPSLAAANKRIGNILKKAEGVKEGYDKSRTTEAAETALATAMESVVPSAKSQFDRGDYTASLKSLAALREPVDAFFDQVMVNAEDPAVRANRLGLLATLHREMNRVADLSKLAA